MVITLMNPQAKVKQLEEEIAEKKKENIENLTELSQLRTINTELEERLRNVENKIIEFKKKYRV